MFSDRLALLLVLLSWVVCDLVQLPVVFMVVCEVGARFAAGAVFAFGGLLVVALCVTVAGRVL
jgi:hypothetical protein